MVVAAARSFWQHCQRREIQITFKFRLSTIGLLCIPLFIIWLGIGSVILHMRIVLSPPPSPPFGDYPDDLEVAIYFFGLGNAREKFQVGKPNPYYHYKQPTLLYIHGWEPGTSSRRFRESFDTRYNVKMTKAEVTSDDWINDDWNVGIFYWNQLADDDFLEAAEAKIYTPHGPYGMRWRQVNGTYHPFPTNVSVAELLIREYVKTFRAFKGPEIRIIGHSLGTQVALEFYRLLASHRGLPRALLPRRIELLDPYCTSKEHPYLSLGAANTACQRMAKSAALAASRGVALQTIQTSAIAESAALLKPITAWTYWRTDGFPVWDFRDKHLFAVNLYFLSFRSSEPPAILDENGSLIERKPLASRGTVDDIRIMMTWRHHGLVQESHPSDGPLLFRRLPLDHVREELTVEQFMAYVRWGIGIMAAAFLSNMCLIAGLLFHYWRFCTM